MRQLITVSRCHTCWHAGTRCCHAVGHGLMQPHHHARLRRYTPCIIEKRARFFRTTAWEISPGLS